MKILYIIHQFYWAGAEKLVYDLAQNIAPEVDRVDVVALYRENTETEAKMIQVLEQNGVHISILDKGAGADRLEALKKLNKIVRTVRPDVIHAHCLIPSLYGKVAGIMNHIPVVDTIHNTKGYPAAVECLSAWMVKRYISIGESVEEYMTRELHLSPKKIIRIYNAIDTGHFDRQDVDLNFWRPYGGQDSDISIVNVARVAQQKNQICILRAMKRCLESGCQNIKLYILGIYNETDEVYRNMKNFIEENHMQKNVHFLGMRDNVADFLANADCFVMTSWYEGLSVSFLEAVCCGVPIIATDMPFVRELNAISGCAEVIAQDDDQQLSKKLMHQEYQPQTPETVNLFRDRFSMDNFVKQHLDVYESIT